MMNNKDSVKEILIINGANLNLLGKREEELYGCVDFETYLNDLRNEYKDIKISYFQSNIEGEIVNALQQASADAIIINAGGYTHTSVVIRDAILAIRQPVVEVHISNIFAREEFRQKSLLAPVCKGSIIGFGLKGYKLAMESFLR